MAKTTEVRLTDDLDGSDAVEELTFALRGTTYEIDLNAKNVAALEKALGKFINAGRKPTVTRRGRSLQPRRGRDDAGAIRDWARENGFAVSNRGRIPAEIREAYSAAR
jgi:hypothetical protein